MRTEAPKEREGRGWVNLARTTPEFPVMQSQPTHRAPRGHRSRGIECTVRAGNLAPDDAELGAANLLLGLVDVGDLLAEVEAVSSRQLRLASRCSGWKTYLAALVSSTPSILIRLVLGCVVWRLRW